MAVSNLFKVIFGLASVVVLFFLLLIVVPYLIPASKYQHVFLQEIEGAFPGKASVESLRVRLFPKPSFKGHAFSVIDQQGRKLLTAASIEGEIAMWKTVRSRQLHLRSFALHQGELQKPVGLKEVEIHARPIGSESSFSWSLSLSAQTPGLQSERLLLKGELVQDRKSREIKMQKLTGSLADFSFTLEGQPTSFHFISSDLRLEVIQRMFSDLIHLPKGVEWSGLVALDLNVERSGEEMTLKGTIDATRSTLSAGTLFAKGADLPLRFSLVTQWDEERVEILQMTVDVGQSRFDFTGSVERKATLPATLLLASTEFTFGSIRPYVPLFTGFGDLISPSMEFEWKGPLLTEWNQPVPFAGRLKAAQAIFGGETIDDLELAFQREGEQLSFSYIRGKIYGGTFSAKGLITLAREPEYQLDLVVDRLSTDRFVSLHQGTLKGEGSLVAKITTRGDSFEQFARNIESSGTLIVPDGEWTNAVFGGESFSDRILDSLKPFRAPTVAEPTHRLKRFSPKIADLKVDYRLSKEEFVVESMAFRHRDYNANFSFSGPRDATVAGRGMILLNATDSAAFLGDPLLLTRAADQRGEMAVPVTIGGTLTQLSIMPDEERFAERLSGRKSQSTIAMPLSPEVIPSEKTVTPPALILPPPLPEAKKAEEKKEVVVAPTPAPTPPASQPKAKVTPPSSPPEPQKKATPQQLSEEDVDDVLKVIIGE